MQYQIFLTQTVKCFWYFCLSCSGKSRLVDVPQLKCNSCILCTHTFHVSNNILASSGNKFVGLQDMGLMLDFLVLVWMLIILKWHIKLLVRRWLLVVTLFWWLHRSIELIRYLVWWKPWWRSVKLLLIVVFPKSKLVTVVCMTVFFLSV